MRNKGEYMGAETRKLPSGATRIVIFFDLALRRIAIFPSSLSWMTGIGFPLAYRMTFLGLAGRGRILAP